MISFIIMFCTIIVLVEGEINLIVLIKSKWYNSIVIDKNITSNLIKIECYQNQIWIFTE